MEKTEERRTEPRLRYHWFMQFANNVKEPLSQGKMVDVSSQGASFICLANKKCPSLHKLVTTRFSVPCFDSDKAFDTASFSRIGRVCRVDDVNSSLRRVAIQFARPLPLKPARQNISIYDRTYKLTTSCDGLKAALSLEFDPQEHNQTTPEENFH